MICVCKYCDGVIEYDNSDIQLALGEPNEIYVICPVCGKSITIGVADQPSFDFDNEYGTEWF